MEEAKYDEATSEKLRLEQKQRTIRKHREERGEEYEPRYFKETEDEHSGEKMYKFMHTYW